MAETHTSTAVANRDCRLVHAGLQSHTVTFNSGGASLSAGDTIQMVPVPAGAVIRDVVLSGVIPTDATVVTVGTGEDANAFIDAKTLSATAVLWRSDQPAGHGFQVSLTDTAEPHFDTVDVVLSSGTTTATCSIVMTVDYYMPPK